MCYLTHNKNENLYSDNAKSWTFKMANYYDIIKFISCSQWKQSNNVCQLYSSSRLSHHYHVNYSLLSHSGFAINDFNQALRGANMRQCPRPIRSGARPHQTLITVCVRDNKQNWWWRCRLVARPHICQMRSPYAIFQLKNHWVLVWEIRNNEYCHHASILRFSTKF